MLPYSHPSLVKDCVGTMGANDGTLEAIILNQAITYAALVKIKPGSCSFSVLQARAHLGAQEAQSRQRALDLHVDTGCWHGITTSQDMFHNA